MIVKIGYTYCVPGVADNLAVKVTQMVDVLGSTRYEPVIGGVVPEHESTYTQSFNFDILGNMTTKTSVETVYPEKTIGDALNYSIDFSYAEGFAHRLDHAGDRYYSYDDDGNVVRERNEAMTDSSGTDTGSDDDEWDDWDDWDDDWGDGLGEAGFGFGMGGSGSSSGEGGSGTANSQATVYERIYEWDERDRLTGTTEGTTVVGYVYGEDGNRTNKFSSIGETLYFNNLWTWHDAKSLGNGGQNTKNIYLGTERIVSKLNRGEGLDTYSEEYHKTYYWHTDHLGSAHFITDYQGNEYQRIEYTPYGEEWIELKSDTGDQYMPYKFTGKERDEETGLYYYGARYLDPVYSRWLSTDPAVGEYIPAAGADNSNLPGMGGVFNHINGNLYHYAGNNPIKYTDPDGRFAHIIGEIIAGVSIGAVVVLVSQVIQDVVINGEISDFATYAGAAAGGAAGGLVLAVTKNTKLANFTAGFVGGAVGNTTKQIIKEYNGEQDSFDIVDCAEEAIIEGSVGAVLHGGKVKGITSGRNSFEAIAKSIATKMDKKLIKGATLKTGVKIGVSRCVNGTLVEGSIVAPFIKNEVEVQKSYLNGKVDNVKKITELERQKKMTNYYRQLYGN